MLSDPQTIEVKDTTAPVVSADLLKDVRPYYPKTDNGVSISLPKISAEEISDGYLDTTNSYVSVTRTMPGTSPSTYTVEMKNWGTSRGILEFDDNGNLSLNIGKDQNGTYTIRYHVVDAAGNVAPDLTKTVRYGDTVAPQLTINANNGFLNKTSTEYKVGDTLKLDVFKLDIKDAVTSNDELLKTISIKVENETGEVDNEVEFNPEEGIFNTQYTLKTAGDYKITVTITDEAGWETTKDITITVNPAKTSAVNTYQVVGTILIVLSVLILVGVVGYFIYSKIKLDKETKKKGKN